MSAVSGTDNNSNVYNTNNNQEQVALNDTSPEGLSTMFLELLVAQISHQNPLNPMDGTQYVSQLAEFSNVESLQSLKINSGKSLQFMESMQALEATALVGKTVDVPADTIVLEQRGNVRGAVNLGVEADAVSIKLYDTDGKLVEEQNLPYSGVGTLRFEFSEQDAGGYYVVATATIDGTPLPLNTLLSGEVERISVGAAKDDIILQVNGLGNHALFDINQLTATGNS
ncbi:flagellar hook capping FlgD N-terminal domain-containing protein [Chromatiaceae bacterium AAb-1]|nr:flagellar hook capping FlgD N-terminal domain-containing protein [Chromatiaceae bacterium AAb-1]